MAIASEEEDNWVCCQWLKVAEQSEYRVVMVNAAVSTAKGLWRLERRYGEVRSRWQMVVVWIAECEGEEGGVFFSEGEQ